MPKGSRGGSKGGSSGGAPSLDNKLIERANGRSVLGTTGDATKREYERNSKEISNMDLTSDEKKAAYKELHNLTTKQLEAEGKVVNPYAAGVGVARFNQKEVNRTSDNAVNARAKVNSYMENLRNEQTKKAKAKEQKALTEAMTKALKEGALSFTVNGKTWTRKTKRGRTFTST